MVKNPPANARDAGDRSSIPESGRSPGRGDDNPLQYSCLRNSMDKGLEFMVLQRVRHDGVTEHSTM